MALILDRQQLCKAVGVSDSAISAWEKKGMPTVRKGRGRGMKSLYDFDAVNAWRQENGYGMPGSPQMLARESSPRTLVTPIPSGESARAPVQISARRPLGEVLGEQLGVIFANSLIPAAAMGVDRYKLDADLALNMFEDLLLMVMYEASAHLQVDEFSVLFCDELEATLLPEKRAGLLARIVALAEQYRRDAVFGELERAGEAGSGITTAIEGSGVCR